MSRDQLIEDIRAYRAFHECSLADARDAVLGQRRRERLETARVAIDLIQYPDPELQRVIGALTEVIDLMLEDLN